MFAPFIEGKHQLMFTKLQRSPRQSKPPKARARPFQVDARRSPREWEASQPFTRTSAPAPKVRASATNFEQAADEGGVLDPSNSALLESSLACAGTPLSTDTRHWAALAGISGANTAVLHHGPSSDQLASHLGTDAFTVGHHVFESSSASRRSAPRRQELLHHEFVHVGQNQGLHDDEARVINRAPPDEITGDGADYHATDQVKKYVLDAEPYDAGKFARNLSRGSDEQTLAYLERMLRVLYHARNLSDRQKLSAIRFRREVFLRFPNSSMRPAIYPSTPPVKDEPKKESGKSSNTTGVISQTKLTAEERAYAEAQGFFGVAGLSRRNMTTMVKSLRSEQDAKYAVPKDADKATKKELRRERKVAGVTLMKAVMEEELSMILPSESDPVRAWFSQHQTNVKFLGQKIGRSTASKYGGVHRTFAERLARAESDLISVLGVSSAKECGQLLGVEKIGGLRGPKSATGGTLPSLHVYGLAIDINDYDNPMPRNTPPPPNLRKENRQREKKGEAPKLFTNEVITMRNASELINGTRTSLYDVDRRKMPIPKTTALIRSYSTLLETYFSIRGNRAKVEKYLQVHDRKEGEKDTDEWLRIIDHDYKVALSNDLMDVVKPNKGENAESLPPPTVAPLITLRDEMIIALEKHGIEWAGRHKTPDIMHFDLRSEDFKRRRPQC